MKPKTASLEFIKKKKVSIFSFKTNLLVVIFCPGPSPSPGQFKLRILLFFVFLPRCCEVLLWSRGPAAMPVPRSGWIPTVGTGGYVKIGFQGFLGNWCYWSSQIGHGNKIKCKVGWAGSGHWCKMGRWIDKLLPH